MAFLIFFSIEVTSQTSEDYINIIEGDKFAELLSNNDNSYSNLTNGDDISIDEASSDEGLEKIDTTKIFGFDYIQKTPRSITSTSDLPVPNDYIISLGDEIRIILTGVRTDSLNLNVGLDGTLLIPDLGAINVFGESLSEVRKKIENLVDLSYVGTEVSISLSKISARKVNILGAVKNPGTYIVNPFSTISSALAYSGGFEDYSSLREITLIRGSKRIYFDLYDLLIFGDRKNDINIQQGDTIIVNSTINFIEVDGSVNRPYIYEFKPNETVDDMINFAMGFKKNANTEKISITYNDIANKTTRIAEVNYSEDVSLNIFNQPEKLEVFSISASRNVDVRVTGPIENQGYFALPKSKQLIDLINDIRLTTEINPFIAVLQQDNNSKIFSLLDKETQKIEIGSNAEIIFFNKNDNVLLDTLEEFQNENFPVKAGKRAGNLTYNTLKLIDDYKLTIFYEDAEIQFPFFGKARAIEIIDYLGIDTTSLYSSQTTYIAPIENVSIVEDLSTLSFAASKFNKLSLRSYAQETIAVNIAGQVKLPGKYIVPDGATLADLYQLAEGITNLADPKAVLFTRQSILEKNIKQLEAAKIKLQETLINSESDKDPKLFELLYTDIDDEALGRITGDFTINSSFTEKFLLENGDSIFLPKKNNTIAVVGEVHNPTTLIYEDGMTIRKLINLAGGYTQNALRKSVYIIRSDGMTVRPSGAFSNNLQVLPGDTVVIPFDLYANRDLVELVTPLTSILSNLAFSAAAIQNLNR